MHWLMVSADTPREALGGTELYVLRLAETLLARGEQVSWAHYGKVNAGPAKSDDRGDGIRYYQMSVDAQPEAREQGWRMDPIGLDQFREVLKQARPDCVHLHGFGRGQSPEHLREAKQAGARVLMTYHAPGQSCSRWDLLYKDHEVCAGKIDVTRCTDCALHRAGVPAPLRAVLANVDLSSMARTLPYGLRHPFVRRKGLVDYRDRWMEGMAIPDKILWHAEWVRDLLLLNGIQEERLHHLPLPPPRNLTDGHTRHRRQSDTRRFVYIGRLIDIKGVHVITEAMKLIPQTEKIEVHIIGAKGPDAYRARMQSECAQDDRLKLMPPVPFEEIPGVMNDAEAVIVPSIWPETGPYTVLEALWTGTPVIGSDRAGIKEMIELNGGGVLIPPANPKALANALMDTNLAAIRRNPSKLQADWTRTFNVQLNLLHADLADN